MRILYDSENIKKFKYLVAEDYLIASGLINVNTDQKVISIIHSADGDMGWFEHIALKIYANRNQTICQSRVEMKYLDARNRSRLANLDNSFKCELAHTGPYHLGRFLDNMSETQKRCRKIIEEKFSLRISPDKPLLVCMEDEFTLLGPLIRCLNHIRDKATIIFKPLHYSDELKLLDQSIIIYDTPEFAPNILRFSADIMMVGILSGAFSASLMLGQLCIPYFTRYIRIHKELYPYKSQIPMRIFPTSTDRSRLLKCWPFAFDLLDYKKISDAITNSAYSKWFFEYLPTIKDEIFGDYTLDDPAALTAAYIMEFVDNGTLGDKSDYIYLKRKIFE